MKSTLLSFYSLLVISIFTASCNRPECTNNNPTFTNFLPDAKEYKSELAKQIQRIGTGNLTYWFDKYLKKDNKEFILIDIQGDELCAKGEVQVMDWNKISGMRREVSGYRGAELKGLKIEIKQDSSGTNFIYQHVDQIID